jgi:hypothetical protein
MIQDSDDRHLRALFHEELGSDATDAPEFTSVWANAVRRSDSRIRRLRVLTLAAVLIIGAMIVFFSRPSAERPTHVAIHFPSLESRDVPWRSAILLTEWRAPSDALLPAKLQP